MSRKTIIILTLMLAVCSAQAEELWAKTIFKVETSDITVTGNARSAIFSRINDWVVVSRFGKRISSDPKILMSTEFEKFQTTLAKSVLPEKDALDDAKMQVYSVIRGQIFVRTLNISGNEEIFKAFNGIMANNDNP